MITRTKPLLLLCLFISGISLLQAQDTFTVHPQEYPGALSNPLKGFRPDKGSANKYDYPTIVRHYIRWNEIENDAGDGVQKIIDYSNDKWQDYEELNIKVIPRVYLDWDSNISNEYWPADLTDGDWSSDEFKERVVELVYKLGQAWDTDPRVAWVQTGIIGYWGEQENPVGIDEDEWDKRIGDAFTNAFPNKKLVVRNQNDWPDYEMGVYWDSFAHPGQKSGSWADIKRTTAEGRYLTQVVEGETAYNWGENVLYPVLGSGPNETLSTPTYYNYLIDVIRELHCTGLGWVASYDPNDSNNDVGALQVQKAFGYRFKLAEFSLSQRAEQGGDVDVSFKVVNTGSAPFYEDWPVAFVLIDPSSFEIVHTQVIPDVDIRDWHPGADYDYDTHDYTIPADEYVINASVPIPAGMDSGSYMAGLTILEPNSRTPGVFFAMENFVKESQTQPLAMIGIGSDVVGGHEINPAIFDDPLMDDNRSYTLAWNGPTVQLTTSAATGGTVSPGSGEIPKNRNIWLKAEATLGYEFSHWSGDYSGTENPVKITMDSDRTYTAHFTAVPTYTLTIEAENGEVTLSPSGGVYNQGTEVKINVAPDLGYVFTEWTGDLTGSDNPVTITMDANKDVTASFSSAPVYTLTTRASGGSVSLDPKGPQYTAGTVVTVEAIADQGFMFTGWSGDPLDNDNDVNPNQVTMDSDKNIIAEFEDNPDDFIILKNGDFSQGLDSWAPQIVSPAIGTISVVDGECKIAVDAVSDQDWHISMMQPSLELASDEQYTLSFDARANSEKTIVTHAQFDHDPWTASFTETVTLTTTMQRFRTTWFQTTEATTYKVGFFLGADTSDVWIDNVKLDITTGVKNKAHTSLPQQAQLLQNYPNPFNPETTIPYQLTKLSHVNISIHNTLGQQVTTLVNQKQTAGYYTIKWSGNDKSGHPMASGIYFIQMKTGQEAVQTKKFLLAR